MTGEPGGRGQLRLAPKRGAKHLLVVGTTTNYSVLINAVDAAQRGYQVTIVEDGTARFD